MGNERSLSTRSADISEESSANPRLILISAISGMALGGVLDAIHRHASALKVPVLDPKNKSTPLHVENCIVAAAEKFLAITQPDVIEYGLINVLRLPLPQLAEACHEGFRASVLAARDEARRAGITTIFLTFHPVFYHQQNAEYVAPYDPMRLAAILKDLSVELRWIVSLHDDLYSIHRRLLGKERLFDPGTTRTERRLADGTKEPRQREALTDLLEQRVILDWRDRELGSARALSLSLGCRHFLLHRLARVSTFWDVVVSEKPAVYFSHPISQPRRDITGAVDPERCPTPDPIRGQAFINECQDFADRIASSVPLVEPTSIDELRIATARLGKLSEKDLMHAILPPLTKRWPIGEGERLGNKHEAEYADELTPVGGEVFDELVPKEDSLKPLEGSVKMIAAEVRRQINVRDHILAQQAGVTVVFRPFSNPFHADASGGVEKEVITVIENAKLGNNDRRVVLIFHPSQDERRRREIVFDTTWEERSAGVFRGPKVNEVKNAIRQEVVTKLPKASRDLKKSLLKVIEESGVVVIPIDDESSMTEGALTRRGKRLQKFISDLVDGRVLHSELHLPQESNPNLVRFYDENEKQQLATDLNNYFEGGDFNVRISSASNAAETA
jgi:hypothetical protein